MESDEGLQDSDGNFPFGPNYEWTQAMNRILSTITALEHTLEQKKEELSVLRSEIQTMNQSCAKLKESMKERLYS